MKILFLGTGPAEAIPRRGHRDAACRDARRGGKSRRTRSAALVRHGGATILIDAGPDIFEQLERARPKRLDAVFLTHGHEDAIGGIRDLDQWLGRQKFQKLVPIYTDAITTARLKKRFPNLEHTSFSAIALKVVVDKMTVRRFSVKHAFKRNVATCGFLFNRALAYASDVRELPKESRELLAGIPTLVLDAATYFGTRIPTHLSTDAALAIANELKTPHLILTQIGHSYPPHETAARAIQNFRKQFPNFPKRITLAFDGFMLK